MQRSQDSFNKSGKTQPNQTMKNTGVLTLNDFRSMREKIQDGTLTEDQERKLKEKQDLKDKSNARVKNWPNTIQALRRKKDDARFEKFRHEEEERRKIDEEEAKYQARIKEDILSKANKQIYETNDRVKSFQSAMLVADVEKEREAQIEINKRKKEIEKIIESKYFEQDLEVMRAYDEKEIEKKRIEEEKRAEAHRILREQHDEFKVRYLKKLQEEKMEGEIIKKKAVEEIEKQKLDEIKRKEKVIAAQEETRKANDHLNELRRIEKEKELQKEKEIEEFAKRKEEMVEMRKQREEMKFKEKQRARQKIIDDQVERLRVIKNKEDEILNKHIKEAEIKAEENERIKREKREQLARDIDKQITLTLEKKALEKEIQKIDDKNFQEFWKKKCLELEKKDLDDKQAYRERCKLLNEYHQKQAHSKEKKLEAEILKELEDAQRVKCALEDDERVFNSYAEKCLNEWQDNGKNIKPMLLELQKYKAKIV